jgi:SAM-dependent methyltransferase
LKERAASENQQPVSEFHGEFKGIISRFVSHVALTARRKMYALFAKSFENSASVLDVGVTSESVAAEANFFEEFFPFKNRITAVGIEDADFLEKKYPGLKFVRVKEGESLPFSTAQFEVVFSNAVIEHVTEDSARLQFLIELSRVGKNVFITTPCPWFPVEHHTGMPFVHWFPKTFAKLLDSGRLSPFYRSNNLRPLLRAELENLARQTGRKFSIHTVYTLGFPSNYVLILR